jgi:CDGSH-type Zn-finger protein
VLTAPRDLHPRGHAVRVQRCDVAEHPDPAADCPFGVVPVRERGAEDRDSGVADELLDDPAETLDLSAEGVEEQLQPFAHVFGVVALGVRRGVDDVDEQDRNELALLRHRPSLMPLLCAALPCTAVSVPRMSRPWIRIVAGGPMLVEGLPLGRLAHDGDAWRVDPLPAAGESYAVCRCGASSTMPLCDRPAPYACFEEEPATGPDPVPFRWDVPDPAGPPALALKPNGPVRVAGKVEVTYDDAPLDTGGRVSLCRCGESRCQPVCDSSHKVVGYRG